MFSGVGGGVVLAVCVVYDGLLLVNPSICLSRDLHVAAANIKLIWLPTSGCSLLMLLGDRGLTLAGHRHRP